MWSMLQDLDRLIAASILSLLFNPLVCVRERFTVTDTGAGVLKLMMPTKPMAMFMESVGIFYWSHGIHSPSQSIDSCITSLEGSTRYFEKALNQTIKNCEGSSGHVVLSGRKQFSYGHLTPRGMLSWAASSGRNPFSYGHLTLKATEMVVSLTVPFHTIWDMWHMVSRGEVLGCKALAKIVVWHRCYMWQILLPTTWKIYCESVQSDLLQQQMAFLVVQHPVTHSRHRKSTSNCKNRLRQLQQLHHYLHWYLWL